MGYTLYNVSARSIRANSENYAKADDTVFKQNVLRQIHAAMDPNGMPPRECRDSEAHPLSIPIIIGLDVTGSMLNIPKELVRSGLPTMMSTLLEKGLNDASVCFIGIGDHEYDQAPLQVGQFESGDAELDMHLTRTWLESGGGANAGESYQLAYYFASRYTITDAFEKRGQKGFLFTIGDEPTLSSLSATAIKEIFGEAQAQTFTTVELLKEAQKFYNVYHIVVNHSHQANSSISGWKDLLGQNCIVVEHYSKVASTIADILVSNCTAQSISQPTGQPDPVQTNEDIIL